MKRIALVLAATLVAFANPWISLGMFAALALYWLIPGTGPTVRLLPGSDRGRE